MNKEEAQNITNDVVVADALVRVKALTSILIAKGIFTKEEYAQEMETVTKKIVEAILEKSNLKKDEPQN